MLLLLLPPPKSSWFTPMFRKKRHVASAPTGAREEEEEDELRYTPSCSAFKTFTPHERASLRSGRVNKRRRANKQLVTHEIAVRCEEAGENFIPGR